MPLIETKGAASAQGFGEFAQSGPATYIEDVFSTWLYTGNGSTQTITNGIDLSGNGGLVWIKGRAGTESVDNHIWTDTVRGYNKNLYSNLDIAQTTSTNRVTSFLTNGFTLGTENSVNNSATTYASWTFRKQPKFFDVVTYTGNATNDRVISHSLGSVPGCIIVKRTDSTSDWQVYHRSLTSSSSSQAKDNRIRLNSTAASGQVDVWAYTAPTSTNFTVSDNVEVNASGATYVAYLFAHDAGGFGLTGSDNVISCGSYNGTGVVGQVATLGYEPQWVLIKATNTATGWFMFDTMRGMPVLADGGARLYANTADAETALGTAAGVFPTATGFGVGSGADGLNQSGGTYIYIAIRRGPMKVPTSGTEVFKAVTGTYAAGDNIDVGFPADMYIDAWRTGTLYKANYARLMKFANSNDSASQNYLKTNTTDAEITTSQAPSLYNLWNTTAKVGSWNQGVSEVWWLFRRAPGFFDVVCYTGTGVARTVNHNLGVAPELMIVKMRSADSPTGWIVYAAPLANPATSYLVLNLTDAVGTGNTVLWNSTAPTSTVFSLGTSSNINSSGQTNVAYLFATVAGVSKVGSYTGTGATQTINCGFTNGSRFVLIKRTDSTGDWYVWDSARGIVSGNDPYLLLNSTAAEVTNTDYVDTYSAGFEISSTAPAAINANGGTFIFLAIA